MTAMMNLVTKNLLVDAVDFDVSSRDTTIPLRLAVTVSCGTMNGEIQGGYLMISCRYFDRGAFDFFMQALVT